jgi:FkbM family methyltransferase
MNDMMKRLAAKMPASWQQEMKRLYFRFRIKNETYGADEPETILLRRLVRPGDWVLDIGANIGHYTLELSRLVGPTGRVIAFEPVPASFELLSATAALAPHSNITLVNAAASSAPGVTGMSIPRLHTGIRNYYRAALHENATELTVLCIPIDAFPLPHPITVGKIDAEGHELSVLMGMQELLRRDLPLLIVEDTSAEVQCFLESLGYRSEKDERSPNRIYRHPLGVGAIGEDQRS